jgi:hypothetical protein
VPVPCCNFFIQALWERAVSRAHKEAVGREVAFHREKGNKHDITDRRDHFTSQQVFTSEQTHATLAPSSVLNPTDTIAQVLSQQT